MNGEWLRVSRRLSWPI